MFPRPKFSITLWATVCTSLLFAAIVSGLALAQQTTAEKVRGSATVSTSQVKGEVVLVEGNDLLVKLSTGDLKTFHVPETRKFLIDGRELSVHDLRPGTTLTATVKTTTTPVTVRTEPQPTMLTQALPKRHKPFARKIKIYRIAKQRKVLQPCSGGPITSQGVCLSIHS